MIHINTTATIGKSFRVKREKVNEDREAVIAHLQFTDAFVDRDTIDELLKRPIGWATGALFDELGAPLGPWRIGLPYPSWTLTGAIRDGDKTTDPNLKLGQATLDAVSIELTPLGGMLSGAIAWLAEGDEIDHVADLLGKICALRCTLDDGGQQDLLSPAGTPVGRPMTPDEVIAHNDRLIRDRAAPEDDTVDIDGYKKLTNVADVMAQLRKGWELCGADPQYWLRHDAQEATIEVWVNAARAAIKRGLKRTAGPESKYGVWVLEQERAA